jgi:hypothetical protein
MRYRYRMVQVPPNVVLKAKVETGTEAAMYLERIANQMAAEGWEFYRVDEVGVALQPGCHAALLGARTTTTVYHVITFRRPAS